MGSRYKNTEAIFKYCDDGKVHALANGKSYMYTNAIRRVIVEYSHHALEGLVEPAPFVDHIMPMSLRAGVYGTADSVKIIEVDKGFFQSDDYKEFRERVRKAIS